MTVPVKYGDHEPYPAGTSCVICGNDADRIVADHRHSHGWVRGSACFSCNGAMASIDRGRTPSASFLARVPLEALNEHASRCPECVPGDLSPRPARPKFVSVNLRPEARDALQAVTCRLTGAAGRRLSMSEALIAMADNARPDELAGQLDA